MLVCPQTVKVFGSRWYEDTSTFLLGVEDNPEKPSHGKEGLRIYVSVTCVVLESQSLNCHSNILMKHLFIWDGIEWSLTKTSSFVTSSHRGVNTYCTESPFVCLCYCYQCVCGEVGKVTSFYSYCLIHQLSYLILKGLKNCSSSVNTFTHASE